MSSPGVGNFFKGSPAAKLQIQIRKDDNLKY